MTRTSIGVAVFSVCCGLARAGDLPPQPPQSTSASPAARFELVQSTLAANWTFRLDRYSGRIWKLVKKNDDDSGWEEMRVMGLPRDQFVAKPHFQVTTSGLVARHTFLIDNDTGKTWAIVIDKLKDHDGAEHEVDVWRPLVD